MINTLNSNFKLSEKDIIDFNKKGFLLLKGFFSQELIKYLKIRFLRNFKSPQIAISRVLTV